MSTFTYPKVQDQAIFESSMMQRAESETTDAYVAGLCTLWAGSSGVGKTTTAEWMRDRINRAYVPENPDAFRARYLEVAQNHGRLTEPVRALKSVYRAVAGHSIDPGTVRGAPLDQIAQVVAKVICDQRVGMLFVDEAQRLGNDAVEAILTVYNLCGARVTGRKRHQLTVVFIGMGNLPTRIRQRPQISRRIGKWVNFKAMNLEDTWDFLATVNAHFAALDRASVDAEAQVRFVHEVSGGHPGAIGPLILVAERTAGKLGRPLDEAVLRMAFQIDQRSMRQISEAEKHGWVPPPEKQRALGGNKGKEKRSKQGGDPTEPDASQESNGDHRNNDDDGGAGRGAPSENDTKHSKTEPDK
jgi:hypothetical protein